LTPGIGILSLAKSENFGQLAASICFDSSIVMAYLLFYFLRQVIGRPDLRRRNVAFRATGPDSPCALCFPSALSRFKHGHIVPPLIPKRHETDAARRPKSTATSRYALSQQVWQILCKEPRAENRADRKSELFWALFAQLFAQFCEQLSAESLSFWNT
jgi:hypothetical protein